MKNADIKQLALLCELIDTHSLTQAASRMAITPSAASQSLARLRETLGDQVCVRDGQEYRLTPYGELTLDRFRQVVALWRQASEESNAFDPAQCTDRLSIACSEAVAIVDPVDLYTQIAQLAPNLSLDLRSAENSLNDIVALRAAQVDLVCTHLPPPNDAADLHMVKLVDWRATVCCLSARHPRIGPSLSLAEYLAEVHLTTLYGTRRELNASPSVRFYEARGWHRRTSLVHSLRVAADIVSRSDRLMTCNVEQANILMRTAPGIRCLPLPPEIELPPFSFHMVWHQRTRYSASHRWLREQVTTLVHQAKADVAA